MRVNVPECVTVPLTRPCPSLPDGDESGKSEARGDPLVDMVREVLGDQRGDIKPPSSAAAAASTTAAACDANNNTVSYLLQMVACVTQQTSATLDNGAFM